MIASERSTEIPVSTIRHTAAHLLAHAVKDLYPETLVTIGPATDQGFYYDFARDTPFTPEDLEKLELRMRELVTANLPMRKEAISRETAVDRFRALGETYKVEIISAIPADAEITLYSVGEFTDLCRGPHVERTGVIGAVKLLSIAGAYWRGDEKNPMLQRIYGTAFASQEELDAYLLHLEEAAKRDHRKLGRELDLFSIEEDAGGGLVFWHPRGAIIRGIIESFIREGLHERGYQPVITPHVVSEKLYATSGHLENFAHGMFGPVEVEGQRFRLKPMNCPGHILIYRDALRSYRDLPVRYSEFGTVYRFERSGTLHGLTRVRGFTQDDAHLFCTPEQLQGEFESTLDEALRMMNAFGFSEFEYFLSTREQRGETDDIAEAAIRNALESRNLPYKIDEGGGAFYGPKLDINLRDAIGRPWQLGTVQVDFVLPERFELSYRGADGSQHRPVMIHRALAGSMERFFGVLLEHYGGNFPAWLAPVQAVVLPISEHQADYAQSVRDELRKAGFRVEMDATNEKLGYKIRHWKTQKVPYLLVAGKSEVADGTVSVNERAVEEKRAPQSVASFAEELATKVRDRT